MGKLGIYPGTFDPITFGHLDIIKRSLKVFDEIIVAVAPNPQKKPIFDIQDRVQMIQDACSSFKNISIQQFDGLLVKFAKQKKAIAVIRGLRAVSDFEYELQVALMNQQLDSSVQTVFMMPSQEYTYLTSSIVKAVAMHGGEVKPFVPAGVADKLKKKFKDLTP